MLMERKGKFDYILLETTGIADPGPVASIFWLDEELGTGTCSEYTYFKINQSIKQSVKYLLYQYKIREIK